MHGEFKVPGGKLVVVDLEVVDGRISDFRLAGDFFLEPDSALESINAAVTGLPADTEAPALAKAVRDALPEDALLLGFSPESVATTIRRALQKATSWTDYEWQLIQGPTLDPVLQMALDQVLSDEVGEGRRKPTLRIWEWEKPAVVSGAMFMEAGAVITYSLYAPAELVQGMSFSDSYAFFDEWVIIALKALGTFRGLYGLAPSEITPDEFAKARQLVTEKFGTEEWLQRVP